jgi:hypothetical protein
MDGSIADGMITENMLRPIEGPAAWRGDDLVADPSWRRTLTAAEVAALEHAAAAAASRGVPATAFGPTEFPVPELQPVFTWLADRLENGPGVARLSGIPVDRVTRDTLRRLFWGFCVNLGTPLYQTAAGEILGEVKDETGTGAALTYDWPGPLKSARTVARSTGALRFHTDKCDMICLLCVSNGIEGGLSKVVSSVTLHNEIGRRRPDLLRVLYEPYWRMRPYDEEGDAERDDRTFAMPVFARGPDASFTSQYSRTYISQAQEVPKVPRLTAAQVEAMDMIHAIGEEVCLQMPFAPGDIQFMNQHVTYHGRTAFTDDVASGAHRVLMRVWLAAPFTRPLPAGQAVQWGDVRAGALRGGAVAGKSAIVV